MAGPEKSKQRISLNGPVRFGLLIVVALLALALFGEEGIFRAYKLSRERQRLEQEVSRLKADNEALRREIELLRSDRSYLEGLARRELGMVREDELVYQFLPPSEDEE